MQTYIQLIKKVKDFYNQHLQVERCEAEFLEQIDNYTAENEKYPLVFLSTSGSVTEGYVTNYSCTLHCLDIIQKDRANINNIISDTQLFLTDFYREIEDGNDELYSINSVSLQTINNAFCDYLAGSIMTFNIEVEAQSLCELPLEQEVEFYPIITDPNTYLSGGDNLILVWQ